MDDQQKIILITSTLASVGSAWTVVSNWFEKRDRRREAAKEKDARLANELEITRKQEEDKIAAAISEREEKAKDAAHRRRLEELAKGAVRASNLAAKKANEAVRKADTAATEATASREEIGRKIEESKNERSEQIDRVLQKQDTVLETVEKGISTSNGYNDKIAGVVVRMDQITQSQQETQTNATT